MRHCIMIAKIGGAAGATVTLTDGNGFKLPKTQIPTTGGTVPYEYGEAGPCASGDLVLDPGGGTAVVQLEFFDRQ